MSEIKEHQTHPENEKTHSEEYLKSHEQKDPEDQQMEDNLKMEEDEDHENEQDEDEK